jgi:hypothetical protein
MTSVSSSTSSKMSGPLGIQVKSNTYGDLFNKKGSMML